MEDELQGTVFDSIVNEFATYEDYLDSQITETDLYYLEDEDLQAVIASVHCNICLSAHWG